MLSMYKAGQGYWTRMMSAIFFGVLVAGGALWLAGQIGAMNIAPAAWRYTVESTQGLTPGTVVELRRSNQPIGTALVQSTDEGVVDLVNVSLDRDSAPSGVQTIVVGDTRIATSSMQVIPRFEKTYLQGGFAGAVLLIGAIVIYWFCYTNRRSSEFLIATEGEMKKVNWSSRREVFGSTWVVISISIIIAAILFVTDLVFQFLSREIGLLQI
ncbi:MAG: preprotein translocase subunit SecE [Phycisphaerales bacterium]